MSTQLSTLQDSQAQAVSNMTAALVASAVPSAAQAAIIALINSLPATKQYNMQVDGNYQDSLPYIEVKIRTF